MVRDGCGACTPRDRCTLKEHEPRHTGHACRPVDLHRDAGREPFGADSVSRFRKPLPRIGRYPGSGGPTGGGPFPGGNKGGRGKTADPAPGKSRKDNAPVTVSTTGTLRVIAGKQFVLEADDHRIITYKTGDKMTVQKDGKAAELSAFATGDHLTVDSTSDDQGYFTAVTVTFNRAGTAREIEDASRTWDLPNLGAGAAASRPSANKSDDDDDRPTLRRKNGDSPAPSASSAPPPATVAAEPDVDDSRPTTLVRPSDPAPDADDPGRPQLRHGKPAPRQSASNTEPEPISATSASAPSPIVNSATAPADAIIPIQEDPIVVKAKDAAAAYAGSLPNFFCRQLTTRYQSDNPKAGWQALDTISADVAYQDGSESYTNIKVGNKPQKSMEDVGGN